MTRLILLTVAAFATGYATIAALMHLDTDFTLAAITAICALGLLIGLNCTTWENK